MIIKFLLRIFGSCAGMSEDEDGAAAVFAAVDELEMRKGRRGLVGGNFRDQVTFGGESVGKVGQGKEFRDEIRIAVTFPIRRIGEDEIVGRNIALEERKDIGFDRAAAIELGLFQVFIGHGDGLAVFVHKHARGRTTAEGLEPERAGTAEEIEDAGIEDMFAENGKNRLPDKIRGRARNGRWDFDGHAAGFSCDDSHCGKSQISKLKFQGRTGGGFFCRECEIFNHE